VPEPPAILVKDKVQTRFVELVVTARATVPVNPLSGATVIVEVAGVPAVVATLVGLAVTLKSLNAKVMMV